jgi:threonine aldolase
MSFEDGLIDLRSDTVTRPTPAMRAAMAAAEVGDDVFGDDPTVIRLQERAAAMTGQAAALFVASGTMANLVAILTHCQRGAEAIVGSQSHMYLNEVGGMAALAGVQACTVPNQADGTLKLEDIEASIRDEDVHHPRTRMVCLENTQNICGGVPLLAAYVRQVAELAHRHGLVLHIDGARLFNAAVAQGVSAAALAGPADSVMFCLSKGLSAPVGSVLCGPEDFIAEARRSRKQVGGGMRQVGVTTPTRACWRTGCATWVRSRWTRPSRPPTWSICASSPARPAPRWSWRSGCGRGASCSTPTAALGCGW